MSWIPLYSLVAFLLVFSEDTNAVDCSNLFLKERNPRKLYTLLRFNKIKCASEDIFYRLSERLFLANRLKEALWSVQRGLKIVSPAPAPSPSVKYLKLRFREGSILKEMNRFEEAIISFKRVIQTKRLSKVDKVVEIQQKSLLQLIDAYYRKAGNRNTRDVIYLINLFKNRYPDSQYKKLLSNWLKTR